MTQYEFIEQLEQALQNDLGSAASRNHLEYYKRYIQDEIRTGKSEQAVLDALGDPWAIARTIIQTQDTQEDYFAVHPGESTHYENRQVKVRRLAFDTWWKRLLLVLGIIAIVVLVFIVVTGLISALAPILIPLIIVMIVLRWIGRRRT
ncbi:MAG: DUF1700 domain-containing protein [Lachnospiraceae bacterium]|nr:DUF1700 domain-containing protein [Lachnospiraceae bacterium]